MRAISLTVTTALVLTVSLIAHPRSVGCLFAAGQMFPASGCQLSPPAIVLDDQARPQQERLNDVAHRTAPPKARAQGPAPAAKKKTYAPGLATLFKMGASGTG